jgi:hypothetical protein
LQAHLLAALQLVGSKSGRLKCCSSDLRRTDGPLTDGARPGRVTGAQRGSARRAFVPFSFPQTRPRCRTESENLADRAKPGARPTGFEPVTFGFVDRAGCSVGLVWARDSALYRDWSSSGFVWTPSRPLPFRCPKSAFPHASRRVREGQSTPLALRDPESAALHGNQHRVRRLRCRPARSCRA